ncbi:MAG: hypothetical protein OXC13_15835 [Caldilineaceae bacterium]|nr:hypothetical protein [Caldilineaceae bacterium]
MAAPRPDLQPTLYGTRDLGAGCDHWIEVRDGDDSVRALFDRHYSRRPPVRGRPPSKLFVGPGEKLVLRTADALAILVWRTFRSRDNQEGVNCAVFRNEGPHLSSDLLRAGMAAAWRRWPDTRLYTYVNPRRVRSPNPGYCFKRAGWRHCGRTAKGLHVLECWPAGRRENP